MNTKIMVSALLLIGLILSGCSGLMQAKPPGEGNPPVITASFAADRGMYGDIIKVYLAAEDPHGDMDRVAVQVSQVGYGVYPSDWIRLKEGNRARFVGYLQWNTARGEFLPEGTRMSINMSVLDRRGNESNKVVLPYEFVSGTNSFSMLPAPFDQADVPRLGYISIVLRNGTKSEGRR